MWRRGEESHLQDRERPRKKQTPLTPCAGTSSFQNCEEISVCCLSHPVCGTWLSQPEQMSILCFQPFYSLWTFVRPGDPTFCTFQRFWGVNCLASTCGHLGLDVARLCVTYCSSLGLLSIFLKFVALKKNFSVFLLLFLFFGVLYLKFCFIAILVDLYMYFLKSILLFLSLFYLFF